MIKLFVKQFRKIMGRLREKPDVRIDDHEFEHLLLYHGLVGTSPDNQRSFKDVRVDIMDAVSNGSSLQLGIAVKLQPLHWQDKLEKIFSEIVEKEQQAKANLLAVLLPDREGEPWPDQSDPLGHPDWRVRANAAFALSYLGFTEAGERMIKCLDDTASSASPAYPHIAQALARLQGEESKRALLRHIDDPEPWFRIDTAAALADFTDARVKDTLIQSLLTVNPLSDYLAVALSKKFPAAGLLNDPTGNAKKAGCQMITGLLDAANQTFTPEILQDTDLEECATRLIELATERQDVYVLRAMAGLVNIWRAKEQHLDVADPSAFRLHIEQMDQILRSGAANDEIGKVLSRYATTSEMSQAIELLDAIQLSGELKIASSLPDLLLLLKVDSPLREDIVAAIGTIGNGTAAPALVDLARQLYKAGERTGPSISAVPVVENDVAKSKLYWRILQSLGNLPDKTATKFLFESASDFAPDKRQQIMDSLFNLYSSFSKAEQSQFAELVKSGLDDPSATVRVSSLKGVGALHAVQHLERVLKLSDSQEPSISRQALSTLGILANSRDPAVLKSIQDKLNSETDEKRKRRLAEVIKRG